jgi:acyl-CoA synthetase (AMP-forming)/AMP-acid ligase II
VKPGETGEITAIGENIMRGYFDDPEETAAAVHHGRYFTGDLATVDEEGYIFIVGRSKNIIKSGGFRISPKEIEDLILTLPEVTGCVVIGLPDEIMGEAVSAVFQTPCPDKERVKKDIVTLCTGRLPSYKAPKYIDCIEEYPLNSSNKVDRTALRLMILDQRRLPE